MNPLSVCLSVVAFVAFVGAIVSCNMQEPDTKKPPVSVKEPDDNSYRIVKMSNGKYRVESYYKSSLWHAIGQPDDEDMSLELANRVYESLTRKRDEPERVEVIK